MKIGLLTIFAALVVAACATPITTEELANADYGSEPSNYERTVREFGERFFKDGYSAQYRYVFGPQRGYAAKFGAGRRPFGYVSCVMVNAKNSFGAYIGERPYFVLVRNNQVAIFQEYGC